MNTDKHGLQGHNLAKSGSRTAHHLARSSQAAKTDVSPCSYPCSSVLLSIKVFAACANFLCDCKSDFNSAIGYLLSAILRLRLGRAGFMRRSIEFLRLRGQLCSIQDSGRDSGFTLIELLAVMAVIASLAAMLLPAVARGKDRARQASCFSNLRQVAVASRLYMDDYNGSLFHHHEGWVLDDGTQVDTLPSSLAGVAGGGMGNSQAEKPWIIFLQPYLQSRQAGFCPSDPSPRSRTLARDLAGYNGGITSNSQQPPPTSELAIALNEHLSVENYLLNSIFTHKSARYALEGALSGFATEAALNTLANPNIIVFSERNSESLDAADNPEYGSVNQDDYDTWVGEAALVQWGSGKYGDQGWLRYNRHGRTANYVYFDGHVESLSWTKARLDQFPDHIVRGPLSNPPH
jgi:prepilin-type N-terminal cleavage/methylation domain-containing protein/prepilin-type processing-associated H-X9-DG protein